MKICCDNMKRWNYVTVSILKLRYIFNLLYKNVNNFPRRRNFWGRHSSFPSINLLESSWDALLIWISLNAGQILVDISNVWHWHWHWLKAKKVSCAKSMLFFSSPPRLANLPAKCKDQSVISFYCPITSRHTKAEVFTSLIPRSLPRAATGSVTPREFNSTHKEISIIKLRTATSINSTNKTLESPCKVYMPYTLCYGSLIISRLLLTMKPKRAFVEWYVFFLICGYCCTLISHYLKLSYFLYAAQNSRKIRLCVLSIVSNVCSLRFRRAIIYFSCKLYNYCAWKSDVNILHHLDLIWASPETIHFIITMIIKIMIWSSEDNIDYVLIFAHFIYRIYENHEN